jgi:hypothetical protein
MNPNPLIPTLRDWVVAGLTILIVSFVSHIPAIGAVVKWVLGL